MFFFQLIYLVIPSLFNVISSMEHKDIIFEDNTNYTMLQVLSQGIAIFKI